MNDLMKWHEIINRKEKPVAQQMDNIEGANRAMQELADSIDAQNAAKVSGAQKTGGHKAMRPVYRELSQDDQKRLDVIKDFGATLWDHFDMLGSSRETALAKTN